MASQARRVGMNERRVTPWERWQVGETEDSSERREAGDEGRGDLIR